MKAGQHFERACSTPSFLDEKSCMSDTSCMKCRKDPAVICCLDCHLHTRLCGLCDQLVHNFHPFHDCDAVKSGFPSPIPPAVSTDSDGEWIFVGVAAAVSKQLGTKQMYSSYFQRTVWCWSCIVPMPPLWERPANLWPTSCHIIWVRGSISMSYVFDPEVVLHWDLFQKESPGSSERSFERKDWNNKLQNIWHCL